MRINCQDPGCKKAIVNTDRCSCDRMLCLRHLGDHVTDAQHDITQSAWLEPRANTRAWARHANRVESGTYDRGGPLKRPEHMKEQADAQ